MRIRTFAAALMLSASLSHAPGLFAQKMPKTESTLVSKDSALTVWRYAAVVFNSGTVGFYLERQKGKKALKSDTLSENIVVLLVRKKGSTPELIQLPPLAKKDSAAVPIAEYSSYIDGNSIGIVLIGYGIPTSLARQFALLAEPAICFSMQPNGAKMVKGTYFTKNSPQGGNGMPLGESLDRWLLEFRRE